MVIKPYPLPRVGKKILQLEEFHYDKALDLNIGYYIIEILTHSKYMKTIFTKFGKFR